MPHKRKGSSYWWTKITPPGGGTPIRRSTGTVDYREAKALESKWRSELYQQNAWGKSPQHSFAEVAAEFLGASQHKRSYGDMQRRVARLYDHIGAEFVMEEMRGDDVRAFISARQKDGVKPATINRELSILSAMINYAIIHLEWPMSNPVRGRMLKEPEGRVRWLTHSEADRLVAAAKTQRSGERLADFILLGLNTGARMNELLKMTWSRVDFDNALLHLEGEDNKSAKRRSVPLNDEANAALKRRWVWVASNCPHSEWVFAKADGERLGNLRNGFNTACSAARIANFRIHDLRHTCASWMVSQGVPLLDVKDVLGHSTVKMTEKYAHLAPHRARDAVNMLGNRTTGSTPAEVAKQRQTQSGHSERPVHSIEGLLGRKRKA
ncbi:tyrosine-type recombinase/integrase [Vreelandella sedimenti]|uniref:tyrosine-type recombinase/integrase n=1 Tax=Vreelandella sedimenti TaxID=2729618 RepID=UPI002579B5B7|nr:site-specific integrase [Halomonas sp. UBA3173]|tara:strand:- start:36049 stop:37191 length:1143 start_codon:yes stop_codon:yes gene_type:complete